ncbi:MAG: CehA/McbA family metallohydrolase [Myxococcota bacterium]|nr:CehA/McbA family metallohydrolase [Myxococcota bacterium]
MSRNRVALVAILVGCGGGGSLEDYYPSLPGTTGEPQAAFAGRVTDASQLVSGPAKSGLLGDYFIANDRVRFIVEAPGRTIGVNPYGGNVIDAVLTDGTAQTVDDHFGELGLIYKLGRTCEPTEMEIVRDGSKGGVAVLRARGRSGNNDFINLKGIGPLRVDPQVDPNFADDVDCATTYVLAPGSTRLEVHHSLFNDGDELVQGPIGTIADSGGNTEAWTSAGGFERADISALVTSGAPKPMEYVVYQAPNVAYGVIPRPEEPQPNAHALVAGVSVLLTGNSSLLDILREENWKLQMKGGKGKLQSYDLVVGRDGAQIDEVYRTTLGETLQPISGRVTFANGAGADGARVGVFLDGNGNGQLDAADVDLDNNTVGDDKIITYLDVADDGTYSGNVSAVFSPLLVRAEIKNVGRSPALPLATTTNLTIPSPIELDYQILDGANGMPIPGRLLVIGEHPAFPDTRVFETYDRADGIVQHLHVVRGTTSGADADPALVLPAGSYRVYASRGTEWSIDSKAVNASDTLTFNLRHVNPSPGYIGSDWHVHQVGSPDANVLSEERVRSAISAGLEIFAVTDHDYIADLQPLVERMGLASLLRVVSGLETTPFAHGHFNAWPFVVDPSSSNGGAVDWARGAMEGFAMTPGEIFGALRERGARMVQVNHPRGSGFGEFQAAFSRANVKYDYDQRLIFGDFGNASIPYDDLRLPSEDLWNDNFNGLEVWNGFSMVDSNGDGLRENTSLDRVMRDWLSMLSLGFVVSPAGNSDTHTTFSDPVGMPRTYVRVPDDSPAALANGSLVEPVLATQTGAQPRDIVVTNGPMITVTSGGQPALGRTLAPAGNGEITLTVTLTAPDWAEFDTLEVFANTTPENLGTGAGDSTLLPLRCWTSRTIASLPAGEPCVRAALAPTPMTVTLATVSGTVRRYEATVTVTLDALDIVNRPGATGTDAWLVFRVRGDRSIFPVLPNDAIDATTVPALLGGDFNTIRTALIGKGVPATAFTAPVFVDFDGAGYRAPFAR